MAGGTGRVCDFFLQGRCRFGDNCKNEHPREQNQQNRFAPLSNQGSSGRARSGGFGGDRYRPGQQSRDQQLPYHLSADAIRLDLTPGGPDGEKPIWPLSAYGAGRDAPRQLLEGIIEQSFEEVRVLYYLAKGQGKVQEYVQNENDAIAQANQQVQNVLSDLDGAINYIIEGENQHPNRLDGVVKNDSGFRAPSGGFGQPSTSGSTASTFGQPPAPAGGSTFGQPSQSGGSSVFGQPSQPAGGSAFGRPSPLASGSAFGQPSQPSGGSGFGQPSQLGGGGGSAFGQPSGLRAKPAFGQPSQPIGGSGFGQPSALGGGSGGFGQPSSLGSKPTFGQPNQPAFGRSMFGQPATQQQNPFASQGSQSGGFSAAAGQSSGFAQAGQGQQQQPNPLGQASNAGQSGGFGAAGAQAGNNPFASKTTNPPAFGQPTQPSGNVFGQTSSQPSNGIFDQASQPASSGAAPAPANTSAPSAGIFRQPSQTAAPVTNVFGGQPSAAAAPQAPASTSAQQPSGARVTGPAATASYTTRTANGTLQAWKGQQVMYDEKNNPTYLNPQTRKPERIWHPDGPPQTANAYAEAPPEVYSLGDLAGMLKQVYDYVNETEQFKEGIMPEIPPKTEWLRWDL